MVRMMAELLTDEDLRQITGATQVSKQKKILLEHGIFFINKLDGSIVTTWHHVNHPSFDKVKSVIGDDTPNLSAI